MNLLSLLPGIFFVPFVNGQDGCKVPAFLSASSGAIESPYYHYPELVSNRPSHLSCRWTIFNPTRNNLLISFAPVFEVDIWENGPCNYEALYYFAGSRDRSVCSQIETFPPNYVNDTLIYGPLCKGYGPTPEPFIIQPSRDSIVTVEFCASTDVNFNTRGFRMFFNATDEIPPPPTTTTPRTTTVRTTTVRPPPFRNCGGGVYLDQSTNRTMYIEYPLIFTGNAAFCQWNISAVPGHGYLKFTVEEMRIDIRNCSNYGIAIVDLDSEATESSKNSSGVIAKWCNKENPVNEPPVRASGSNAAIILKTEDTDYAKFRIKVEVSKCDNINHIACPDDPTREACFSSEMVCDGKVDCPSGVDENCPVDCGIPAVQPWHVQAISNRIYGGLEARPHSFPWHAALLYKDGFMDHIPYCGGTIIDHHYIITSGECCFRFAASFDSHSRIKVLVGEHDLSKEYDENALEYAVQRVSRNSLSVGSSSHDLCAIKTLEPMLFNHDVSPVCLNMRNVPTGTHCFLAGWASECQSIGDTLHYTQMAIRNPEECGWNGTFSTSHLICAGDADHGGFKADQGGALVCPVPNDPGRWEMVGVYRNNDWNGKGAQWFTKVSNAVDWIAETVILILYCVCQSPGFDGCKAPAFLTASSGSIASPYYDYPEYNPGYTTLACRWTIYNPNRSNLLISFAPRFELDFMSTCSTLQLPYQALYLYYGARNGSVCSRNSAYPADYLGDTLIYGPLCQTGVPRSVILPSSEGVITVEFCKTVPLYAAEFRMFFNATDDAPTELMPRPWANCSSDIHLGGVNVKSIYIDSPRFASYTAAVCQWKIFASSGHGYIKIIPEEIRSSSRKCQLYSDSMTVVDGTTNTTVVDWCGVRHYDVAPVRVSGNTAIITLLQSTSRSEFRLKVELSNCPHVNHTRCPNDPHGESCYSPEMFCDGKVDCPNGADEDCLGDCGVPAVQPWQLQPVGGTKVVGGTEARPHSFPWHVSIYLYPDSEQSLLPDCAGTLIDHRYVLTAGECCSFMSPDSYRSQIRVGQHYMLTSHEQNVRNYTIERQFYSYGSYTESKHLCLVKTKEPIFLNDNVQPVCLGTRSVPVGTHCYLAGWEDSAVGWFGGEWWGEERGALRYTAMIIRNAEECGVLPNVTSTHLICAGGPENYGCSSYYSYDKGGALVCPVPGDPDRWEIVGVLRGEDWFSTTCTGPNLFDKVSAAVDWIAEVVMSTS
ncbi:ovochymase-like [Paramacrobiotus metropolitanus]|uniref:ovochymase-like n=1 Tax=Paramacrobiotus metropolitanus TaxID=2943436 RepID=UPI002445AC9E|nr:ovochymase-like [Paramacrobiotus metropolitanus]